MDVYTCNGHAASVCGGFCGEHFQLRAIGGSSSFCLARETTPPHVLFEIIFMPGTQGVVNGHPESQPGGYK